MLSRFLKVFLRFSKFAVKEQLYFNFMAAVTIHGGFGAPKINYGTVSTFSPSVCQKVMGLEAKILVF